MLFKFHFIMEYIIFSIYNNWKFCWVSVVCSKTDQALQTLRISIAKFEVILTNLSLYVSSVPSYDKNDSVKHAG